MSKEEELQQLREQAGVWARHSKRALAHLPPADCAMLLEKLVEWLESVRDSIEFDVAVVTRDLPLSMPSLQAPIGEALLTSLAESRASALDQRRVRDVIRALAIPEAEWVTRLAEIEAAIAAGQSIDDLGVMLNEWAGRSISTLMERYLAASVSRDKELSK